MSEADYNETLKAANEITDKHKRMLRNLEDDPEMKINYPERLRKFNKAGQLQYEWLEDVADCIEDLEDTLCSEKAVSGELTSLTEKLEAKLEKAEQMLEREIRRVQKIQADFSPPHTIDLSDVVEEYELMLAELKGEYHE